MTVRKTPIYLPSQGPEWKLQWPVDWRRWGQWWWNGPTQCHFCIFPRCAFCKFQCQIIFGADLVGNFGKVSITLANLKSLISAYEGGLAVQIGRIAKYARSISQGLQNNGWHKHELNTSSLVNSLTTNVVRAGTKNSRPVGFVCRNSTEIPSWPTKYNPLTSPPWWAISPFQWRRFNGYAHSNARAMWTRGKARVLLRGFNWNNKITA